MVKDIQSTASRASILTAQLQTIGRSASLEPTVFEPVAMLQNNANVIERIVGESITVEWSLDRDAGAILVDAGQFEQMMLNLAINARDAMPDGGELRISAGTVDVNAEPASAFHLEAGPFVEIHVPTRVLAWTPRPWLGVLTRSSRQRVPTRGREWVSPPHADSSKRAMARSLFAVSLASALISRSFCRWSISR